MNEKVLPVLRDVICLLLGAYGFAWQVTHDADPVRMGGSIALLAGPAVIRAWLLGRAGGTSTTDSSSGSPSPPSPSPPPTAPSSASAGGER